MVSNLTPKTFEYLEKLASILTLLRIASSTSVVDSLEEIEESGYAADYSSSRSTSTTTAVLIVGAGIYFALTSFEKVSRVNLFDLKATVSDEADGVTTFPEPIATRFG